MGFMKYKIGEKYRAFLGLHGARLFEEDGKAYLVISYDDITNEEIRTLQHSKIEVTYKEFGISSLFFFRFDEMLVDAVFNQFSSLNDGERHTQNLFIPEVRTFNEKLQILICDASSGEVMEVRECRFPKKFMKELESLTDDQYQKYGDIYDSQMFRNEVNQIYDNHTIDEIYVLPGINEIRCLL